MAEDNATDSLTLKKAEKKIMELSLPLPRQPIDRDIDWPSNVADLTSMDLAAHLTWWSGWASYIRYHLAQAETNAAAFTEEMAVITQECIFKSDKDYKTVTELKAAVGQLPTIQRCKAKVLEATAIKRMLKAMLEGYEAKYSTISREISRRDSERGLGGRE